MKIGEAQTYIVQIIEVGCFKKRIVMASQVAISLIIGKNKDYIWTGSFSAPTQLKF